MLVPLIAVLVRVGLDVHRLLGDPTRYWNWEESYNAAVGYYAWTAGLWDHVLRLQQKSFCGGCTVVGLMAAPSLGIFGDELWAWKLVPLLWTIATMLVGAAALRALVGEAAAVAWLVLTAVPLPGVSELGLMAWGNHAESTLFVLGALGATARGRHGVAALLLGLGLWFCRTSAYALVVMVPLLVHRAGRGGAPRVFAAFVLGALPLALPAAGGDAGGYELGLRSLLLPEGLEGAWVRASVLFGPAGLGARAFPQEARPEVLGGAVLAAAGLAAAVGIRRPFASGPPLALLAAYGLLFCVSGFDVARVGNAAPVINLRYHAPWLHLLTLVTAAGVGAAWAGGGVRRVGGVLALAALVGAAGYGQLRHRREADPDVLTARFLPHVHFASMAAGRIDAARLARAHADDPVVEATLRRMEGYKLAFRVRGGGSLEEAVAAASGSAALEGLGQGLVDGQGWRTLPEWYERWAELDPGARRSIGRGAAWNLGKSLELTGPRRVGPNAVADAISLAQRVPDGQPCLVCAAAGFVAMKACRSEGAGCLVEVVDGPEAAEIVYGAGVACPTAGTVDPRCAEIRRELPEALGVAFAAGMRDPMSGADAPVLAR